MLYLWQTRFLRRLGIIWERNINLGFINAKVRALVLENTFLSIDAMVDHLMPILSGLKRFVLRLKWDNRNKISRYSAKSCFQVRIRHVVD